MGSHKKHSEAKKLKVSSSKRNLIILAGLLVVLVAGFGAYQIFFSKASSEFNDAPAPLFSNEGYIHPADRITFFNNKAWFVQSGGKWWRMHNPEGFEFGNVIQEEELTFHDDKPKEARACFAIRNPYPEVEARYKLIVRRESTKNNYIEREGALNHINVENHCLTDDLNNIELNYPWKASMSYEIIVYSGTIDLKNVRRGLNGNITSDKWFARSLNDESFEWPAWRASYEGDESDMVGGPYRELIRGDIGTITGDNEVEVQFIDKSGSGEIIFKPPFPGKVTTFKGGDYGYRPEVTYQSTSSTKQLTIDRLFMWGSTSPPVVGKDINFGDIRDRPSDKSSLLEMWLNANGNPSSSLKNLLTHAKKNVPPVEWDEEDWKKYDDAMDKDGLGQTNVVKTIAGAGKPSETVRGCHLYSPKPTEFRCAEFGYRDEIQYRARFNSPSDVALSTDRNSLYVADANNNAVRKINLTTNAVTTCVKDHPYSNHPYRIEIDSTGSIFIVGYKKDGEYINYISKMGSCSSAPTPLADNMKRVGGISATDGKLFASIANEWGQINGIYPLEKNGFYDGMANLPRAFSEWGHTFNEPGDLTTTDNLDYFIADYDGALYKINKENGDDREILQIIERGNGYAEIFNSESIFISIGGDCPDWSHAIEAEWTGEDEPTYRYKTLAGAVGGLNAWGDYADNYEVSNTRGASAVCSPAGMDYDKSKNILYFADRENHAIRKLVSPSASFNE